MRPGALAVRIGGEERGGLRPGVARREDQRDVWERVAMVIKKRDWGGAEFGELDRVVEVGMGKEGKMVFERCEARRANAQGGIP